MKQGKGSFLIMLWLLIGSLCLGVLLLLLAPRQERPSVTENRMLAGAPVLSKDSLVSGEFFTGVEDFLSDGFFRRDDVINTADRLLGWFDLRTEEQRLIQEAVDTDRRLLEDAGAEMMQAELSPNPEHSTTPTVVVTASPTPSATPTPTPVPTNTPDPTTTPNIIPTEEPIVTPEAELPVEPFATATPQPTATPKVIVPLEAGSEYYLYLNEREGTKLEYYDYPAENLMTFANSLNYLRNMLPEHGEIHYLQVPVAAVGVRLCVQSLRFSGWESTMEDALQTQVVNGVYIDRKSVV